MTAELIVHDRRAMSQPAPAPAAPAGPVTPMQLLQLATSQGADLDRLEKLMELQRQWEANESRKAFVAAMAAFKADPPQIVKNKRVRFQTSKGVTEYDHATHDEVTNKIVAGLAKYGLSHRWNVEQQQGGLIRVTCVVTHEAGHAESVSMHASPDESGSKNGIQAVGSTITYLQRYTLLAATGLSTADMRAADDDGRAGGVRRPPAAEIPRVPPDVATAIAEAATWPELEAVWRGTGEATRAVILKHHRTWWDEQKARAKGAGAQQ